MERVPKRTNSSNLGQDDLKRLRTARRSIKAHLTWFYTCEGHPDIQIPNTTNLLEGFNSQLKRALHNHNGLNEANKKKFIDGFINTKK